MRVYRVEHSVHGSGPYVCGSYMDDDDPFDTPLYRFCDEIDEEHSWGDSSASHPMPFSDGIDGYPDGWRSGFATLADLRAWFEGWAQRLDEHGFVVAKYGVPSEYVMRGGHQVKFDIEMAEKISSVPVSSLVKR